MPKKGHIKFAHVMLAVNDRDEAFKFYHDVLGLPEEGWHGKFFYALNGMELRKSEQPVKSPEFVHLGFAVDDIKAVVEDLKSKGVKFRPAVNRPEAGIVALTGEIGERAFKDEGWVVNMAFFQDPLGVTCELVNWRKIKNR